MSLALTREPTCADFIAAYQIARAKRWFRRYHAHERVGELLVSFNGNPLHALQEAIRLNDQHAALLLSHFLIVPKTHVDRKLRKGWACSGEIVISGHRKTG